MEKLRLIISNGRTVVFNNFLGDPVAWHLVNCMYAGRILIRSFSYRNQNLYNHMRVAAARTNPLFAV